MDSAMRGFQSFHFQRTVELCFLIRGVLYLPVFLACELVVHTHMHVHNTFA